MKAENFRCDGCLKIRRIALAQWLPAGMSINGHTIVCADCHTRLVSEKKIVVFQRRSYTMVGQMISASTD
ncbi:MAG: hypothetical protein Q7N50_05405 [Armatimonadota bacterium]|nr:hypothetical protein [Armatimonadota bacterium]